MDLNNQLNTTFSEESFSHLGYAYRAFESPSDAGLKLGRILSCQGSRYKIAGSEGLVQAEISGHFSWIIQDETDLPSVGDWVLYSHDGTPYNPGIIQKVLPRSSTICRRSSDPAAYKQILAANVQYLLALHPLDRYRSEESYAYRGVNGGDAGHLRWGFVARLLTMAQAGPAQAMLIFTKADLLGPEDLQKLRREFNQHWPKLPVLFLDNRPENWEPSIQADSGLNTLQDLLDFLPANSTSLFMGLSGAGKSTLMQRLLHNSGLKDLPKNLKTQNTRSLDGKGQHTTSHRELFILNSGQLIIDSPGIRGAGIWAEADEVSRNFESITELAQTCRFGNCTHSKEPGCAIQEALENKTLDEGLWQQYLKQQREAAWLANPQSKRERNKALAKYIRSLEKSSKRKY